MIVTLVATSSLALSGCGMVRDKLAGKKSNGGGKPGPAQSETTDTSTSTDTSTRIGRGDPQLSPLGLTGALQSFSSCAAVEAHIEGRMIADMQRQIQQQIKWIEEEDTSEAGVGAPVGTAKAGEMSNTASDSAGAPASGPDEVTTTNNQVEGVEEADFVKNTGTHIFHVSRGKLRILKSWPADTLSLVSETALQGRPFELLFDEEKNRLVVLSHPVYEPTAEELAQVGAMAEVGMPGSAPGGPSWDFDSLDVTVLDVADPAKPATAATYRLKGSYHDARRVGSSVRIVLQSYSYWPAEVVTWTDNSQDFDQRGNYRPRPKAVRIAELEALMAKNEELIQGKDLAWWLETERYVKIDDDGKKSPVLDLGECRDVHAPTVDTEFGLTRIASLDLESEALTETLLLTYVGTIYASTSSLYLTTPYYWWDAENRDTDFTYVHKFDTTSAGPVAYMGSGGVEGSLLNQFAMDEYDGHLRVATTVQRYCKGDLAGDSVSSVAVSSDAPMALVEGETCPPVEERLFNQISVLAQDQGKLTQVGVTEPLGQNERIYSVRYQGARGFMVTFRQTDPLFTLDLSKHEKPTVVGELKVPGYSSYIHMIDDENLLTIGRDATETGQVRGLKLSVFDVADMAAPKELHTLAVDGDLWTEAEYNHKAFNFFASKGLLAIPVSGYRATSDVSALKLFKVDVATGIVEVGELDMTDVYKSQAKREPGWWFSGATVQRSIFADDYVYAIADLGIKAAKVDELDAPVSAVSYTCDANCYEQWWWW
jgi:uncharacterized secreted protein with C-terminal beta-propeller domain/uncharacterized protein YceK